MATHAHGRSRGEITGRRYASGRARVPIPSLKTISTLKRIRATAVQDISRIRGERKKSYYSAGEMRQIKREGVADVIQTTRHAMRATGAHPKIIRQYLPKPIRFGKRR